MYRRANAVYISVNTNVEKRASGKAFFVLTKNQNETECASILTTSLNTSDGWSSVAVVGVASTPHHWKTENAQVLTWSMESIRKNGNNSSGFQ